MHQGGGKTIKKGRGVESLKKIRGFPAFFNEESKKRGKFREHKEGRADLDLNLGGLEYRA